MSCLIGHLLFMTGRQYAHSLFACSFQAEEHPKFQALLRELCEGGEDAEDCR